MKALNLPVNALNPVQASLRGRPRRDLAPLQFGDKLGNRKLVQHDMPAADTPAAEREGN